MPALRGVRGNSKDQHRQAAEIQAAGGGEVSLMSAPPPLLNQINLVVRDVAASVAFLSAART
jgi:hypothetical protein